MKEFSFSTRIFFGEGALDRLQKVKGKNVLIVSDSFMAQSGVVDKVASHLTDCQVTVFSEVVPEPPLTVVAAGVKCLQNCEATVMIAVGGGSCIDAAKAIRTLSTQIHGGKAEVMECFAIPTTSGTGSEVTEYAVITDTEKGVKIPLASRAMRPPTAILDPSLVVSSPPSVTANSGMDALTHALEAYISTGANDFSDAMAEKAVSLLCKWLPIAYDDGENLLAREKVHNASCLAGLAFNSAGLGLCHGMAHTLGARLHVPHGLANAIILPYIIRYNADLDTGGRTSKFTETAAKLQRIAKLLYLPSTTPVVGVSQLIHIIDDMNSEMNIPKTFKALGMDVKDIRTEVDELAEIAMADTTVTTNPREVKKADVKKLLLKVCGL
ncbi:MAG: iron-containing alcohol dehydrogenase [Hespellia sp.]|nr:iron-containing alcohol dehydrogenase [Hespellia sp.]